eukprot:6723754-Prymnesium_polylepis.1
MASAGLKRRCRWEVLEDSVSDACRRAGKGGYGPVRGRVFRPPSSLAPSRLSQADCVQEVRGAGRLIPAALICAA